MKSSTAFRPYERLGHRSAFMIMNQGPHTRDMKVGGKVPPRAKEFTSNTKAKRIANQYHVEIGLKYLIL